MGSGERQGVARTSIQNSTNSFHSIVPSPFTSICEKSSTSCSATATGSERHEIETRA